MALIIIAHSVYTGHLFYELNMDNLCKIKGFFDKVKNFYTKEKVINIKYMEGTIMNACAKYFYFIMPFLVSTVHYELLFSLSLLCFK